MEVENMQRARTNMLSQAKSAEGQSTDGEHKMPGLPMKTKSKAHN